MGAKSTAGVALESAGWVAPHADGGGGIRDVRVDFCEIADKMIGPAAVKNTAEAARVARGSALTNGQRDSEGDE